MLGLLQSEPDTTIRLANGEQKVINDLSELRVFQVEAELVDRQHDATAVEKLRHPVKQVGSGRRADLRMFEDLRHVDTREVPPNLDIVTIPIEGPAEGIAPAPLFQASTAAHRVRMA